MSYERLTIEDDRFLINRMIGQAPRHTLVREFFMNAQESASLAPEGRRLVRILPDGNRGREKADILEYRTGHGRDRTQDGDKYIGFHQQADVAQGKFRDRG